MITNRVGAPGWPRGFQTTPAVLSRVDANERRTKMRMFNVLPRLIKNTVKNLTHFTCNSPYFSDCAEKNEVGIFKIFSHVDKTFPGLIQYAAPRRKSYAKK
jgi:hypothetical protein